MGLGGTYGVQDEPSLFRASQPVSFSVSPRRAAASSSGGTCAGASRASTGLAEWPAVPGQVGAIPSPGVPVSPSGTRLQCWGWGLGGGGLWESSCTDSCGMVKTGTHVSLAPKLVCVVFGTFPEQGKPPGCTVKYVHVYPKYNRPDFSVG